MILKAHEAVLFAAEFIRDYGQVFPGIYFDIEHQQELTDSFYFEFSLVKKDGQKANININKADLYGLVVCKTTGHTLPFSRALIKRLIATISETELARGLMDLQKEGKTLSPEQKTTCSRYLKRSYSSFVIVRRCGLDMEVMVQLAQQVAEKMRKE